MLCVRIRRIKQPGALAGTKNIKRNVSCHALEGCSILSDYKTVKETKAALCEHHTRISANIFSPQIGSAIDHQSNKKSTTISVAENQDQEYKTTLVGLTTGLWTVHAATYTARGNYLALPVYRSTARHTPLETDS